MGWVKDTFLGGAEKKAAQQQVAAGKEAQAIQKQYYDDARKSIMDLMGPQYGNIMQAYQSAADVIGQGKINSSDILKQAFTSSNQIIQSGNDAALSALLGRPSQMQLPQQQVQVQPAGLPSGGGLRSQVTGIPQSGQSWYDKRMNEGVPVINVSGAPMTPGMDMEQRLYAGGQPMMTSQGGIAINQPQHGGAIRTQIQDTAQTMSQTAMQPASMPQAPTISQPDTSGIGLGASEQALQQGLQGQTNAYLTGLNQATGTLQGSLGGQLGALRQGVGGAEQALNQYGAQALGAANQGYGQARGDIGNTLGMVGGSINQGINALQQGEGRALGRIDQYTGQAVNTLNPYAQTGQAALGQEAALSGALGGAAQQQAINQFVESPGQKFLREQGEKAVLRQASATGGLRGGSTLAALQERGIGLAAQNQQQQLENLRSLAGRGQEASTNQAGFQQQAGTTGAGITAQLAGQQGQLYGQQAGIQGQLGSQMAGMANQAGQFGAGVLNNVGQQLAGLRTGLGQNEAGAIGSAGSAIAQGQFGTGQNIGNAISGTGQALSGLRTQAGRDVANQMNSQTGQLSSNQLNLGNLLANLDTNTASQLAQLLTGGATTGANQQNQIATLLANLAAGQGSNLANLQTQIGNAQGSGTVGSAAGMREGIGNVAGLLSSLFSDERLKENITKLSDGPIGIFAWTWKHIKEIPESLRGAASIGVIAQEVQEKFPDCVHSADGWLKVDYLKLSHEVSNA